MSQSSLPDDLKAALDAARNAATTAGTILAVLQWPEENWHPGANIIANTISIWRDRPAERPNLQAQRDQARQAIQAVAVELSAVRDKPVRFGRMAMPNAHEAALALTSEVVFDMAMLANLEWVLKHGIAQTIPITPMLVEDNFNFLQRAFRRESRPDPSEIEAECEQEAARVFTARLARYPSRETADRLATQSGQKNIDTDPAEPSDASNDTKALVTFLTHKDWTKKQIANHIGCHEKSLSPKRAPQLDAIMKAYKQANLDERRRLRGAKDKDGKLEAWEEE